MSEKLERSGDARRAGVFKAEDIEVPNIRTHEFEAGMIRVNRLKQDLERCKAGNNPFKDAAIDMIEDNLKEKGYVSVESVVRVLTELREEINGLNTVVNIEGEEVETGVDYIQLMRVFVSEGKEK